MNRPFLLSLATAVAALSGACTLSQDLGGGGGSVTADGGASTSGNIDSGASTSGNVDSGASTSGNVDSGTDAKAQLAPCPSIPGYQPGPFMEFTMTGGTFVGAHTTLLPSGTPDQTYVLAGIFNSTPVGQADYENHFLVYANLPSHVENGHFVGPSWSMAILTEEIGKELTTGVTYPVTIRPGIEKPGGGISDGPPGAPPNVTFDKTGRYPGTGPGTCGLTVDYQRTGTATLQRCFNARFTCTGLLGKASGETFDVTGRLSAR